MKTDKTLVAFPSPPLPPPPRFESGNSQNISIFPNFPPGFLAVDPWTIACPCRNCLSNLFPGRSYRVADTKRKGSKFKAKLGGGRE